MIPRLKALGFFWALPLILFSSGCVPIRQVITPGMGLFPNNTTAHQEVTDEKPGVGGLPSPGLPHGRLEK